MGFPLTVTAFVVVILGGLGNVFGSLIGGLLLGVLETFGVALTAPSYRSIMIYAVFIGRSSVAAARLVRRGKKPNMTPRLLPTASA